jgi:regulatory protein
MKITNIVVQTRNPDRVNVSVDGAYRFSLDIFQVTELGIKIGNEYTESELMSFEEESVFGRLYTRALEYALVRPRSVKEVKEYLWKKTRPSLVKRRSTGEVVKRKGVSTVSAERVLEGLVSKGYVDDEKFASFWVENRNQRKGTSLRRLSAELAAKGVSRSIIEAVLAQGGRSDQNELQKIVAKKAARYPDKQKFVAYLLRLGFSYDDINEALANSEEA